MIIMSVVSIVRALLSPTSTIVGVLSGGLAGMTPTSTCAALIALAATRWQKERLENALRLALYSLGVAMTLGLSKWPLTGRLWNQTVEPLFIELLDAFVVAVRDGFIKGLRSDNRKSDRAPTLISAAQPLPAAAPVAAQPAAVDPTLFATRRACLVVCHDASTDTFLVVKDARGWGAPEATALVAQTLGAAATECVAAAAGVEVRLAGLLTMELSRSRFNELPLHTVFFARPVAPATPPALGRSEWLSRAELQARARAPAPDGLRGHELLAWSSYLLEGGSIFPLELLQGPADAPSRAFRGAAVARAYDAAGAAATPAPSPAAGALKLSTAAAAARPDEGPRTTVFDQIGAALGLRPFVTPIITVVRHTYK